jgi:hypothetical protein
LNVPCRQTSHTPFSVLRRRMCGVLFDRL